MTALIHVTTCLHTFSCGCSHFIILHGDTSCVCLTLDHVITTINDLTFRYQYIISVKKQLSYLHARDNYLTDLSLHAQAIMGLSNSSVALEDSLPRPDPLPSPVQARPRSSWSEGWERTRVVRGSIFTLVRRNCFKIYFSNVTNHPKSTFET